MILRFPDGDVEYRSTRGELPTGALVRARGTTWRVRSFTGRVALLESAEQPVDGDGAGGGPVVIPTPLGDQPLTLEILSEV
ncbi:MAG TPA: hypothetical protein VHI53_00670 [Gaiellaceae bacterium]|nr:hypothetical protein [Gaiellaceae bacterium]